MKKFPGGKFDYVVTAASNLGRVREYYPDEVTAQRRAESMQGMYTGIQITKRALKEVTRTRIRIYSCGVQQHGTYVTWAHAETIAAKYRDNGMPDVEVREVVDKKWVPVDSHDHEAVEAATHPYWYVRINGDGVSIRLPSLEAAHELAMNLLNGADAKPGHYFIVTQTETMLKHHEICTYTKYKRGYSRMFAGQAREVFGTGHRGLGRVMR